MKIVIISRNKVLPIGTTQLRCIQPFEYLKALGVHVTITELIKYTPSNEDILILHRITGSFYNQSLVQYAQAKGIKVIYDTDDLIFHPKGVSYLSKLGLNKYTKERSNIAQLMASCNAISVSTTPLVHYAKELNPQTFLIKNALSYSFFKKATNQPRKKKSNTLITIAYLSGSSTHDNDFTIVSEALFKILNDFPNTQLLIVGPLKIDNKFSSFGARLIIKEFMPYHEFQNIFDNVDINLIPLEKNEVFCQCKSELKFIEAAAFSTPSIATPTTPHSEIIIHNTNGLLAEEDEWYENIEKLLDKKTRNTLGKEALQTVSKSYSPTVREKDWNELLIKINKLRNNAKPSTRLLIKLKFHAYKLLAISYEKQKGWEQFIRVTFFKRNHK